MWLRPIVNRGVTIVIPNTSMAAAASSAESMIASKSGRALAFASSFTVCLLAAGALAITLLGRPHGASITLDLPESLLPKAKTAAPAAPSGVDDGAVTGPVTQPVYAGKALLADPALTENT